MISSQARCGALRLGGEFGAKIVRIFQRLVPRAACRLGLTELAARAGALTVQVNPNATDIDSLVTFAYRGAAGAVLPELVRAASGRASRGAPSARSRAPSAAFRHDPAVQRLRRPDIIGIEFGERRNLPR